MKIYVGNLSFNTTDAELRDLFAEFGEVTEATHVSDRDTGRPRGFGFVQMGSDDDARQAIEQLNGKDVDGRALTVNEARPKPRRSGGGRRW